MHGGTRWDGVRLTALGFHIRQRGGPALPDTHVETLVHQLDLCAHDAGEHDVSHPVVDRILVRYPALLDQAAFHPDLVSHRRHHAPTVRLHPASRDPRVL